MACASLSALNAPRSRAIEAAAAAARAATAALPTKVRIKSLLSQSAKLAYGPGMANAAPLALSHYLRDSINKSTGPNRLSKAVRCSIASLPVLLEIFQIRRRLIPLGGHELAICA